MLRSFYRNALLGAILLLHMQVAAQSMKRYGLPELVDSTLAHLPIILQKQALVRQAHAGIMEEKHAIMPQFRIMDQVNVGTDNSLSGSVFPLGIVPATSGGIRAAQNGQAASGNLALLYGEYELYNFGLNRARIERALSIETLQRSDLDRERYLAAWRVSAWYLEAKSLRDLLEIDQQNVLRYDSIRTLVVTLARTGIRAGADSSAALAELSRARAVQERDQGRLNELMELMSGYAGIPAGSWQMNASSGSSSLPNGGADTSTNPLLASLLEREHVIRMDEQLIRRGSLPRLLLTGSAWARGSSIMYNDVYHPLGEGLGYQRYNYAAGLTLAWTINNIWYRKDRLLSNKLLADAAHQETEQQRLSLTLASGQARIREASLRRQFDEGVVQLNAAQDSYRQRLAQYKAGMISLIDLTNASFVLYRARAELIAVESDMAQAGLDRSLNEGRLFSFIQNIH